MWLRVAFLLPLLSYFIFISYFKAPTEIPVLPETWWGPGSSETADTSVRPFTISATQNMIQDLKERLRKARKCPGALEGTGWTYGVDANFLPNVTSYWLNEYKFEKRVEHWNRYPSFVTNIQGLEMHFLHVKPSDESRRDGKAQRRVIPLLIQHGWPGSVLEFHKILPLLTKPRPNYEFVFEVIAPSLPGFAFSSPAVRPGLGSPQIAVVLKNLMLRLGFDKFYLQGGDWGAITTADLAALFPQHALGLHSNLCVSLSTKNLIKTILYSFVPSLLLPEEDQHLMYPLTKHLAGKIEATGYFHIQATKPDTIGIALTDSPAGLAAYILEKFSLGTNFSNKFREDGGLLEKFTMDELIDNLMMYWIPGSILTSMRIYAETYSEQTRSLGVDKVPVTVPTACAQFPKEIMYQPPDLLKDRYVNLIRAKKMPRGGHFAAMEEPELLVDDIWESVAEMERLRIEQEKKLVKTKI